MTFHVGQRVIFIAQYKRQGSGIIFPQKYSIYTIRAFCPCAPELALLLHEIHNSKEVIFATTLRRGEPSFAAKNFRPLVDLHEVFSISTPAPKQKELQHNGTD